MRNVARNERAAEFMTSSMNYIHRSVDRDIVKGTWIGMRDRSKKEGGMIKDSIERSSRWHAALMEM